MNEEDVNHLEQSQLSWIPSSCLWEYPSFYPLLFCKQKPTEKPSNPIKSDGKGRNPFQIPRVPWILSLRRKSQLGNVWSGYDSSVWNGDCGWWGGENIEGRGGYSFYCDDNCYCNFSLVNLFLFLRRTLNSCGFLLKFCLVLVFVC